MQNRAQSRCHVETATFLWKHGAINTTHHTQTQIQATLISIHSTKHIANAKGKGGVHPQNKLNINLISKVHGNIYSPPDTVAPLCPIKKSQYRTEHNNATRVRIHIPTAKKENIYIHSKNKKINEHEYSEAASGLRGP